MSNHRKPDYQLILWARPALIGLAAGLFLAYFLGETVLASDTHPLHWLTAAGGASLGYLIGIFYVLIRLE